MATALLLIDIQTAFLDPNWGPRNNPEAEVYAALLLSNWRNRKSPVFHVRHLSTNSQSPFFSGSPGAAVHPKVTPIPGEPLYDKHVNSAFIGTPLEKSLRDREIGSLVICGLTTPHCVSTSVRMAANLGFDVTLAHDACAAFMQNADTSWNANAADMTAEMIHQSAVSQLHGEFAEARSTTDILSDNS